ncbi:hypothetical protein Drorol1_Dr00009403 [Drosera rotundifolia]
MRRVRLQEEESNVEAIDEIGRVGYLLGCPAAPMAFGEENNRVFIFGLDIGPWDAGLKFLNTKSRRLSKNPSRIQHQPPPLNGSKTTAAASLRRRCLVFRSPENSHRPQRNSKPQSNSRRRLLGLSLAHLLRISNPRHSCKVRAGISCEADL